MTNVPLTSGWQVNEAYGLEDEAFGPLLVASDVTVSEVNRRAALDDAIDAVNTGETTDPAILWAAVQVVALMRTGLEPLDENAAAAVENWLVEGEIGPPLTMSARTFGEISDPEERAGVLAAVIAFGADDPAIEAWVQEHVFGAAQLDVAAACLWLEHAQDEGIAERLDQLAPILGGLLDDWARWSVAHRLYDVDFPIDRVLDQLRLAEHPDYPAAVALCITHPYGQQAAALSLTEDSSPQAPATLRELVFAGVPAAPIGLVANIADRYDISLARAIVPAAEGADRAFVYVLAEAVLEQEMLNDAAVDEEAGEETLIDVAEDESVDPMIRGVIAGLLVSNLMDLTQAHELSDSVAGVSAQVENILDKLGVDRSQIPGLPGLPGIPDVAAQQARLNKLATEVTAFMPGAVPDWFTGRWDDLYPPEALAVEVGEAQSVLAAAEDDRVGEPSTEMLTPEVLNAENPEGTDQTGPSGS
ncbi:hypothetical protein [Enemella sp. A6]|uniref:hypothetical protein n=1 Tax=Enemella sp. A6 TaxID=3440152 RepID=UPI003EBE99E5